MRDDDFYPEASEIRILASLVVKVARRDLERRLDSCGVGIRALPFGAMRLLARRDHTLSELSRKMMLTPATLVPVVDALERNGLIRRGLDPADRRRTPLSLTERGAEAVAGVPLVGRDDALAEALDAMGGEKRSRLLNLLRELVGRMPEGKELVAEVSSLAGSLHQPVDSDRETALPVDLAG